MRKNFWIAIGLSVVLLSSCATGENVGIIGGADGPTKVFVGSSGHEQTEKNPVRMLRLDGAFYYDSGKISHMPRCGMMDGGLTKAGDAYVLPKEDGECNFDGATGYQSASGMTVEVPIDNEWVIFKKIDEPEKELSQYTYCYSVKGTMPNAARESEWIVLAHDKNLDFERVTKSFYSSDIKDRLDVYAVPILEDEKWGVMLSAENVTDKGLTLVCEQFGGKPTGELQTGEWFSLETYRNGKWEMMQPKRSEFAWNDIAYSISKSDKTSWKVDWEWLYGKLPQGAYRIGKKIMDFRGTGDYDTEIYYAVFSIE